LACLQLKKNLPARLHAHPCKKFYILKDILLKVVLLESSYGFFSYAYAYFWIHNPLFWAHISHVKK
jgi:hypothetical protein